MIITRDARYRINTQASQREYTDEGYMKVPARLARCGIYKYRAGEIGVDGVSPDTIVRVYRPKDEVFNKDSLKSFFGAVITDDHPTEMVDSDNFKKYELGTVMSEGRQDGDFVQADLLIRDSKTIKKIESGKEELSAGYRASYEYDIVNGQVVAGDYTVDNGVVKRASSEYGEYDVIQRGVQVNHVALVSAGRAGQQVRVFDNEMREGKPMSQITLDSGAAMDITAENANVIAQEFKVKTEALATKDAALATMDSKHKAEIASLKESFDKKMKDKDEELEKKNAELDAEKEEKEKMKKKTSDAAIMERIKAISIVSEQCRNVAGKELSCDSADIMEMKREALKATNDSIDWADKSDAYCEARFDIALETAQAQKDEAATYDHQIKNLTGAPKGVETNDSAPITSRSEDRIMQINGGAK